MLLLRSLILDMIMDPGINGLETYKRIFELHPKQKAIIASGFSETDRVKEAKKPGAGVFSTFNEFIYLVHHKIFDIKKQICY